jgi:hypothetical protein
MVRTSPSVWICVAIVFFWGCKEKPRSEANPPQKQAVVVDYAAQLPVAGNLAEQLTVEAAARPKDAVKVETVLEALAKADIPVGNTRQFIGRTVFATYCFGGASAKSTTVTVCEYASADAAKAGLEHSQTQFASIPFRTLTQNKLTVLTLVRNADSPETKAEMDKAIEVFTKL